MKYKLTLTLAAVTILSASAAIAEFSPPYTDEPRTLQQIADEFQKWSDENPGPSGTQCPYALERQVSQSLFDDSRFKTDVIVSYSNYFGVTLDGQHYSNALTDGAQILVTGWGIVCTGGYENQTCKKVSKTDACNVYLPIHFIPDLDPNGVGILSGKVLPESGSN